MKLHHMIALGCCAFAPAFPAAAQTMDYSAVESVCGAVDREVAAGRAPASAAVVCGNREAARQLSAQLPMRVDQITTVESVEANGTEFVYNVRVDIPAADLSPQTRQALRTNVRANVCGDQSMRVTITRGGSYRYDWRDRDGRPIETMVVESC